MVDLETLSNDTAFPTITSIALVEFDMNTGTILDTFRVNVDIESSLRLGFDVSGHNLDWWTETPEKVKVFRSLLQDTVTISEALHKVTLWFDAKADIQGVWGNSNRFDLGILAKAFNKVYPKRELPWSFRTERDVRTLIDIPAMLNRMYNTDLPDYKNIVLQSYTDEAHDPLYDCKKQIEYVCMYVNCFKQHLMKNYE